MSLIGVKWCYVVTRLLVGNLSTSSTGYGCIYLENNHCLWLVSVPAMHTWKLCMRINFVNHATKSTTGCFQLSLKLLPSSQADYTYPFKKTLIT